MKTFETELFEMNPETGRVFLNREVEAALIFLVECSIGGGSYHVKNVIEVMKQFVPLMSDWCRRSMVALLLLKSEKHIEYIRMDGLGRYNKDRDILEHSINTVPFYDDWVELQRELTKGCVVSERSE